MKKIISILVVTICALIFTTGCNSDGYNRNKHYFKEIANIDSFVSMFNSDETYITVVSQTTCGYCNEYQKVINRVAYDENIDIYWLEYDLLNEEERDIFQSLNERFNKFGTPLTVFTKNGEIIDELSGLANAEVVKSKLIELKLK